MEKIRDGISNRTPKTVERASHALRGAAANLLARGVVDTASKLEDIARSGSLEGSQEALASLEEALGKLRVALGEFEKECAQS
jgi:HPt (histidine-containing phosphotransfer) domain-containing protein